MFVAALRKLAEHCEFGTVLNDALRDRLVCGLKDEAAQKKLLTVSELTLEKAISISVSMEMASKEAQQLHATTEVHTVSTDRPTAPGPCYHCGRMGHLAAACRCKDMDCRNCGKRGHLERVCQSKKNTGKVSKNGNNAEKMSKTSQDPRTERKKRPVHTVSQQDERFSESNEESEVGVYPLRINKVDIDDEGYWTKPLLEGHPVNMQIDTGSKASILSEKVYESHIRHLH